MLRKQVIQLQTIGGLDDIIWPVENEGWNLPDSDMKVPSTVPLRIRGRVSFVEPH